MIKILNHKKTTDILNLPLIKNGFKAGCGTEPFNLELILNNNIYELTAINFIIEKRFIRETNIYIIEIYKPYTLKFLFEFFGYTNVSRAFYFSDCKKIDEKEYQYILFTCKEDYYLNLKIKN